jgi:hypothetical protein
MDIKQFRAHGYHWADPKSRDAHGYVCAYCGDRVSSEKGFSVLDQHGRPRGGVWVCPNCYHATYVSPLELTQVPGVSFGKPVSHVPTELSVLYDEARRCTSDSCFTAAVLACRKMLMNIAVNEGAKAGESFLSYVDYLAKKGFVPPNGRHWVDHIRKKSNEANHEIALMTEQDAKELITFLEMLLRFIYEFPNLVPQPSAA